MTGAEGNGGNWGATPRRLLARFHAGPQDPLAPLAVRAGTMADYARLARFHYRAGPPATRVRVLTLADPPTGETVAVLVVSMPTLNGAWRALAWPGRFDTGDKRADARRLNAELRAISRVIVDPRWRALGAARRLVLAYLNNPDTPATEAVAAMGACCPFFAAAGMTEHRLGPRAADSRLILALRAAGLRPWDLADSRRTLAATASSTPLKQALRTWANWSRSTRPLAAGPLGPIIAAAARKVPIRTIAYTHDAGPAPAEHKPTPRGDPRT